MKRLIIGLMLLLAFGVVAGACPPPGAPDYEGPDIGDGPSDPVDSNEDGPSDVEDPYVLEPNDTTVVTEDMVF
jgi:hypothetical protein